MSGGFFRGTSVEQDARFANKSSTLLSSTRFPALYRQRVDLQRVNVDVLAPWVHARVAALLGMEDDVVAALVLSTLSQAKAARRDVDARQLQVDLTGFLAADAERLVSDLWQRLLDAQHSAGGVAPQLLQARKDQLRAKEEAGEAKAPHRPPRRSRFGPALPHAPSEATASSPAVDPGEADRRQRASGGSE